jgi:hypothetical protein
LSFHRYLGADAAENSSYIRAITNREAFTRPVVCRKEMKLKEIRSGCRWSGKTGGFRLRSSSCPRLQVPDFSGLISCTDG